MHEQAFSNIKNSVSQLRADMDNAFNSESSKANELRLAHIVTAAVKGKLTADWLLKETLELLSADSAIIWVQNGSESKIITANITQNDGKELFLKIIPYLAEQNAINAVFSAEDKHYAAYSHTVRDAAGILTDKVIAVAFVRDSEPFADDEGTLGSIISEAIFSLTI
ncbi:MAG: hypothetical protein LBV09_01135 [Deferribacteraceae bacterium]|jgi:restriction endonuclease S subunit|nr:hypothetical protein [Deferribacteraceae bacterium]